MKGLVSGLFSVDYSVSTSPEFRHYEEALKMSLMLALGNVLYLGTEADFSGDASLRAFVLDNVDTVNSVLQFAEGFVAHDNSGIAVLRRILSFYS